MNGGWLQGRNLSPLFSMSSNPLLTRSSNKALSFLGVLRNSQNPWVWGSTIAARALTANQSLGGQKIALYIACFQYSLLQLLLSLLLLVVVVLVVLTLSFFLYCLIVFYINLSVLPFVYFSTSFTPRGMGRS